jgi:hypothetical protein
MPIRRTITVTLSTHGEVDQPCTASCPDLALSTDGPTVAAALHALAKAIDYLPAGEEIVAAVPPRQTEAEPPSGLPDAVLTPTPGSGPKLVVAPPARRRTNGRTARVLRAS